MSPSPIRCSTTKRRSGNVVPAALSQLGIANPWPAHVVQAGVALLSLAWLRRAWPRERAFLSSVAAAPARVSDKVLRVSSTLRAEQAAVVFMPGPTVLAKGGETLLDIAEANGVPLASGCRMGMCGADPVRIVAGAENVSAVLAAEQATLERLGLDAGCRLACCVRVQGPVTVSPSIDAAVGDAVGAVPAVPVTPAFPVTPGVERVVVIGSGVAGVTTAIEVRKLHPTAAISLIGAESYDFYNRMAIDKLVAEIAAIDKLYLMPRDWSESRSIRYLRGVSVSSIDRAARRVTTDEGEEIPYDRLVLATGARGATPPLDGFGMGGAFVMRTINDAVAIQQHIRGRRCRAAVVVGGGPLGLEAAHSMSGLGLRVAVLDRGPWPLNRQLDEAAGTLLRQLMSDLGIEIISNAEARRLIGEPWLQAVELTDGRILNAELCLLAAGIRPEVDLARAAGLAVQRGVVVAESMATSDPAIYAVGDVAEHDGHVVGLWPAAVAQARVAATNLLGGDLRYTVVTPPMKLKVAGIDLLSVGDINTRGGDGEGVRKLSFADEGGRRYRKLVIREGKLVGAILIGHPELADDLSAAVEAQRDVSSLLVALEQGDWVGLQGQPERETMAV